MNEREERLRVKLAAIDERLAAVRSQSERHLRRLDEIELRDLENWAVENSMLDALESALVVLRNRTNSLAQQARGVWLSRPESLVMDREV